MIGLLSEPGAVAAEQMSNPGNVICLGKVRVVRLANHELFLVHHDGEMAQLNATNEAELAELLETFFWRIF